VWTAKALSSHGGSVLWRNSRARSWSRCAITPSAAIAAAWVAGEARNEPLLHRAPGPLASSCACDGRRRPTEPAPPASLRRAPRSRGSPSHPGAGSDLADRALTRMRVRSGMESPSGRRPACPR
jgi:hypothetical protein